MGDRGVGFALVHAARREAIWLGRGVPDLSEALRVARRQLGWDAYARDPLTLDLEIWGCENATVFTKYARVWGLLDAEERIGERELRVLHELQSAKKDSSTDELPSLPSIHSSTSDEDTEVIESEISDIE